MNWLTFVFGMVAGSALTAIWTALLTTILTDRRAKKQPLVSAHIDGSQ